ncbi:hypothetical protein Lal_00002127 [Lupinus albus]|uniref:Putative F-box domain, leucine-rich repeat domain, L domain-containing protein n=1 Tax=Lupinus albus TaxID=3870 RepID=A0A6A5P895_LUPAL|nr:putative F-box domain, leucine-rich repeat domain, L domain-containing protein [Lupinus albus]KAF1893623.1 hypothetical protein Lal_00002127 [Lupinus albus]
MEVISDFHRWDDLTYDILGMIFTNLSLKERLTVIPCVCKSWAEVITGPYCWQEIDIGDWSNCCEPEKLDRMLEMLITRSSGSLKKLRVFEIQTERIFTFITENANSLEILRLMRCNLNDHIVEQICPRLGMISFLDVSYCNKIGAYALEIIGKNCKMLEGLRRSMHPIDTMGKPLQNDEAYAIASTMPNLKHLGITYNLMDTAGVLQIFLNCIELEILDVRGCWGVKLDKVMVKKSFPKLKVIGPAPEISLVYQNIWPGK